MREDLRAAGVRGLASAGSENWFFGHLGASVVAGHALLNAFGLSDPVRERIEVLGDRIVDGNPERFAAADESGPGDIEIILDAIGGALPVLRNSGHGIIYATLGLRAMDEDPSLRTAAHCDGIARLVSAASDDAPTRYFGVDKYFEVAPTRDEVPEFGSVDAALSYAIAECEQVWSDAVVDDQRYFFAGEKIHGVTYAWALCELERLGHRELAERGLPVARQMLLLNRQVPPRSASVPERRPIDRIPTEPEFWREDPIDPFHVLKLAFAGLGAAERLGRSQASVLRALASVWSIRS